jgi:hypothetical protein
MEKQCNEKLRDAIRSVGRSLWSSEQEKQKQETAAQKDGGSEEDSCSVYHQKGSTQRE